MCPILNNLSEAVGAIQVKQREAKVAIASHGIEVFYISYMYIDNPLCYTSQFF